MIGIGVSVKIPKVIRAAAGIDQPTGRLGYFTLTDLFWAISAVGLFVLNFFGGKNEEWLVLGSVSMALTSLLELRGIREERAKLRAKVTRLEGAQRMALAGRDHSAASACCASEYAALGVRFGR